MPDRFNSVRHPLILFTAPVLILAGVLFFSMPAMRQFLIKDLRTDELLYMTDVKPGDRFGITYIHSVNKSPIEDRFVITEDSGIMLYSTIFKSFGAGVPSTTEDSGKYTFYKDRIEVTDINRMIENFVLFVGVTADHHFIMNGKDFKLNELSSPQRSLQFLTGKITVYRYLKYKLKKHGRG